MSNNEILTQTSFRHNAPKGIVMSNNENSTTIKQTEDSFKQTKPVKLTKKLRTFVETIIHNCADKYRFDANEAIEQNIPIVPTEKKQKIKMIPLPFTGVIDNTCCSVMNYNHGLYTQCTNKYYPPITKNGHSYCLKCSEKSAKKNLSYIEDRMVDNFMGIEKKPLVPYAKVLKKVNITREEVEKYIADNNLEPLEDSYFELPVSTQKRGRHKKIIDENVVVQSEKKRRGRPSKKQTVVEVNNPIDLFQNQLAQAEELEELEVAQAEELEEAQAEELEVAQVEELEEVAQVEEVAKEKKEAKEQAKKEAKEQAKKAEKEAKELAKKAEKEAKEQAKKAEKEAKELAKKAKKGEKETKQCPKGHYGEKKPAKKQVEIADTPEEENDELVLNEFEHDGTSYYKDQDFNVYDVYSAENVDEKNILEPIGKWDCIKNKLVLYSIDELGEEDYE